MDLGIKGKAAMISAASKGLGKATALALAKEGCRLSLCARNQETLEKTCAELRSLGAEVISAHVDVSSHEDLARWSKQTLDHFGAVDILVTNTGGPRAARFEELKEEDWKAGVESTLMNVVRLCQMVIPSMKERRWGRILHITSFVAKEPEEDLTLSSTLRAGISALTRTLARQLGPSNITVNALLPGHTLTERQRHLALLRSKAQHITEEEYFQKAAALIPLRRMALPDEFGEVAAFFASERASYISGASLPIDGGLLRGAL